MTDSSRWPGPAHELLDPQARRHRHADRAAGVMTTKAARPDRSAQGAGAFAFGDDLKAERLGRLKKRPGELCSEKFIRGIAKTWASGHARVRHSKIEKALKRAFFGGLVRTSNFISYRRSDAAEQARRLHEPGRDSPMLAAGFENVRADGTCTGLKALDRKITRTNHPGESTRFFCSRATGSTRRAARNRAFPPSWCRVPPPR